MKCAFSQDVALTDHQMSILKRQVPKFRAAETNHRENIIKEVANKLKDEGREGAEFDRTAVIRVRKLSMECKTRLLTDISSLFATTYTAKLNGHLKNLYFRPENGATLML